LHIYRFACRLETHKLGKESHTVRRTPTTKPIRSSSAGGAEDDPTEHADDGDAAGAMVETGQEAFTARGAAYYAARKKAEEDAWHEGDMRDGV